jgi:flagellar biosynthesis component FlhA
MKNLLLISNVSAKNEQLVEYVAKFCKYYSCKLHVLHLSEHAAPILVSSSNFYKDFNIKHENQQLKKLTQRITKITSGILDRSFIQVSIKKGNEDKILSTFINDKFIDLIIIGNSDLNRRSDFPNHTNVLINMINTPLIVIPDYHIFKPLTKFNFLTTHTKTDLENIKNLNQLFPKSMFRLTHLLSKQINENEKIKVNKWINYLKEKYNNRIEYETLNANLKLYIQNQNFATSENFEGLVFSTNKRNFWSRIFDPSTTLSFLSMVEIPSIIFKIEETNS